MRIYKMVRDEDETGVSGTGEVAEVVEFSDGRCAVRWLTETSSTAVYDSIEDVRKICGHGGKTGLRELISEWAGWIHLEMLNCWDFYKPQEIHERRKKIREVKESMLDEYAKGAVNE